jgi:hypothetical protein
VSVLVLASALVVASPNPVAAECPSVDPWPSFAHVVPRASVVVIGRVATAIPHPRGEALGTGHFTLRVLEVLRGAASRTLTLGRTMTDGPYDCIPSSLTVRVGDEIAVAFGPDLLEGVRGPVSGVAFISRMPRNGEEMPGMQRLTLREIRAIAQLPQTAAPLDASVAPSSTPPMLALAGLLGGLLGFRIRRRRLAARSATG